jgi:hypothetical protein
MLSQIRKMVPVSLQFSEQWLWDTVDEFIYQFQFFYVWRAKVKIKTEEELVMLADGSHVSRPSRTIVSKLAAHLPSAGLERIQCPQRTIFSHSKV